MRKRRGAVLQAWKVDGTPIPKTTFLQVAPLGLSLLTGVYSLATVLLWCTVFQSRDQVQQVIRITMQRFLSGHCG